jgi:predicted RNA binding protein YcfA (HicA-like mRNA interferase family)
MPPFGPIHHADLVRYLKQLGWEGPYPGGKHLLMEKGNRSITIPNPHRRDIAPHLLNRLLRQAKIDRATWEAL